ncbi:ATP-binding protein [Aquimarina addita]|uniref:ATP-binding protein n=1 Tax=Aquimarina addita TaxID=870485 RepID=A0ABP6UH63_9FLAO
MAKQKIIITGGPSTGKTAIINNLEASGYFCFNEFIRSITREAIENDASINFVSNPIASVTDPHQFNLQLLTGRIQQYLDAIKFDKDIVFFDRGIPDVLAYMDLFNQTYDETFIKACNDHRYDTIFLLPPWKEIFVSDNERQESFEEAEQVYHHLSSTYTKLGYNCIEVPFETIENRTKFILSNL